MGRSVARPEINIAARYISEMFRSFGLRELKGTIDYFQGFEIKTSNPEGIYPAKNVMGWVEGTDSMLKKEFIILSSHYDHLGIAAAPKLEEGKLDSIFNGARDNAIGTTAVIDAARYFSKYPAKRSILFITFSGEEMGLLGSKYFAAHPLIELKQLAFNLNNDNASYNDTTAITFVGLGRTNIDDEIKNAAAAYKLSVLNDPTKGRLFYGSDNAALAAKGIPSCTYSLGMRDFGPTIRNRYHQLSDEVGNMDLNYALTFINSFILSAQKIADNPSQPKWTRGDEFEKTWEELHR
jgi:Zn-dependent M28 family amino/carboxypeptidase